MHEGVSRNGSHLFPVFSYDHISGLSDDDVRALYAYFMTRTPVHASARPSGIPFLFNIRYLQAGWKLLLFRPSRFEPGAEKAHFLETQDVQGVVAAYDLSSTKEDDP